MPLFLTPRSKGGASGELPPPFRLERGEAVIGRGTDAELTLANPMVSRRHCIISGEGDGWQLVDTSTAGTLVNGQRVVGTQPLRDGDVLTIVDIELAVTIGEDGSQPPSSSQRMNLDSWQRAAPSIPPTSPSTPPSGWETRERTQSGIGMPLAGRSAPAVQFLEAAGLARVPVAAGDEQLLAAAGAILRAGVAGLSAMARTRRKARAELGVERDAGGAGPLEAGKSSEDVLLRLLTMPPAAAGDEVAAACRDLETHERATLMAMQAAFAAALDRFAPAFGTADQFAEAFADALVEAYRKE
jgi:predicted component of type VI protein secretion system